MNESNITENRIWKYRNTNGLTQKELAFLIGQDKGSQISRYEKGRMIPKLAQLIKLCYVMGIEIESLYPDLVNKWKREVEEKKEELKNTENHGS